MSLRYHLPYQPPPTSTSPSPRLQGTGGCPGPGAGKASPLVESRLGSVPSVGHWPGLGMYDKGVDRGWSRPSEAELISVSRVPGSGNALPRDIPKVTATWEKLSSTGRFAAGLLKLSNEEGP